MIISIDGMLMGVAELPRSTSPLCPWHTPRSDRTFFSLRCTLDKGGGINATTKVWSLGTGIFFIENLKDRPQPAARYHSELRMTARFYCIGFLAGSFFADLKSGGDYFFIQAY